MGFDVLKFKHPMKAGNKYLVIVAEIGSRDNNRAQDFTVTLHTDKEKLELTN